jgi:hypothetical protein
LLLSQIATECKRQTGKYRRVENSEQLLG